MSARRGGRARTRAQATQAALPERRAYRHLRHPFEAQRVFSDDAVARLHETALRVLEELGVKILLPEARELFAKAGASIDADDDMVRIGREIVESALATAPRSIRLRAANPDREQIFEPGAMLFVAGAGCPNATDLERGRRPGSLQDFEETLKLQQSFDVIHFFGPSAEPQDVPVKFRHYEMIRAQMTLGDKPMFIYSRGRQQVQESFDLIKLGLNLSEEDFASGSWATTVINTNSPRQIDVPMAQGIIDFARAKQMSIITPFCLAGAMAPITIAGALVLQHAEALASIALAQLARPGAPVAYGGFSSNVDLKSGSPEFGTPEHVKLSIASGQLARHIDLPWRSASGTASNTPDMQSAGETHMALWGALQANATVTLHAAGWLEGGLSFGYEKFINDVEALQTIAELCVRPTDDTESLAWSALADVQPGGHFFATEHTMERYKTAFYEPLVADLSNFGTWSAAGGKTSSERATEIWRSVLRDFQPPEQGAQVGERIASTIEAWKARGGAVPPG